MLKEKKVELMEYDNDLTAPVWDELNDQSAKTTSELSDTFASLPTIEQATTLSANNVEGDENEEREEPLSWTAKNNTEESSSGLLDKLAPEEDPLSNLNSANVMSHVASPSKAIDDPLFSGSTYLSLVEDTPDVNETGVVDSNSATDMASPIRKNGKPQRLFNSARIRRRPLSVPSQVNKDQVKEVAIADPLGKIKKENEFVDESLEDHTSLISKHPNNKNILEQVNEPLFNLSLKERPTLKDGVSKNNIDEDGDDKISHRSKDDGATVADLVHFDIEVKDPVKVGELTSMHVEYSVISASELFETKYAQVNRRYSDFRWLYRQLQSNHWGKIIPPPPEKQRVGRFKQDFIENRRFQMERMLRKIASVPVLQSDPDFILFLTSPDFTFNSKKREHITGSGASADSNDLSEINMSEIQLLGAEDAATVLKNGGLDGESQKRFMSISFSSLPKYSESDDYFSEQLLNAEVLEERLKELDKSLELVDSERNELASVTEEFSKTIESLAALEVTKKNSDLLTNFAETHRRIKESLERSSLQESLTLGVTLDEYIRSLASLKAIFNQRAKLGQYLVIVESELSKKQAQLEKLHHVSNAQGNRDKINYARQEHQILQNRFNTIKKSWQEVGSTIKEEISNYETEKVRDFRNSMEIFLESAIESQKEAIELWETFYQNNL